MLTAKTYNLENAQEALHCVKTGSTKGYVAGQVKKPK